MHLAFHISPGGRVPDRLEPILASVDVQKLLLICVAAIEAARLDKHTAGAQDSQQQQQQQAAAGYLDLLEVLGVQQAVQGESAALIADGIEIYFGESHALGLIVSVVHWSFFTRLIQQKSAASPAAAGEPNSSCSCSSSISSIQLDV